MENTEAIWQQRLAKRRQGRPWKTIIEAEGLKYGGTFTGQLKQARDRGWVPPEATLPPAIRRDGKRQGVYAPKQETPMSEVLPGQMTINADTATPNEMSLSTPVDTVPVNVDHEVLSRAEVHTLEHYEQIIARGIQTFIEVGRALKVIRDQQLYRRDYQTFEAYMKERWGMSRPRGYQLIGAAEVVDAVSTSVDIVPVNEAQARPLATLSPEQQREVWQQVVETAPPSGITAKHVQATVKRVKPQVSRQATGTPHAQKPEPSRPARMVVQEGLVWGLREVDDDEAWPILKTLWLALTELAPAHQSLRGMLARVERRFPSLHSADTSHTSET